MTYGTTGQDYPGDGCAIVFGASGGLGQETSGLLAQRGVKRGGHLQFAPRPGE